MTRTVPDDRPVTEADLIAIASIFERTAPSPFDQAQAHRRHVVNRAIAVLPYIDDDITAAVVEALAYALVGAIERINASREVISAALDLMHTQHQTIRKLRNQLSHLRDELRAARRSR